MLAVALWAPAAAAQLLPFTHYSPQSEIRALPSAEVHGVYPDRQGYLWAVVYSSGLVRYDGVEMEVFDEDDGLRDVALWEVVEDRAGRLWVASNGGLAVTERPLAAYGGLRRPVFVTEAGGTPLLDVTIDRDQMAPDERGRMWVGTDGLGIVRYAFEPEGVRADTFRLAARGEDPPAVRAILSRADGSIWAGLSDGRLISARGGAPPFRRMATLGQDGEAPSVLYESGDGRLWVGTREGGVWRVVGQDSLVSVVEPLGSAVVAMELTPHGELAVATGATGLAFVPLDGGPVRRYSRQNGLLGDGLHDLARDPEGNLWVAQSGGLSKLRAGFRAFTSYAARSLVGEQPLLPAPAVGAVAPARIGGCDVWAGTSEGVGCIAEGVPAEADRLGAEDGLTSVYVNALVPEAGRLWIGTLRGIFLLAEAGVEVPPGAQSVRGVRLNGTPYRLASYGGSSVLGAEALQVPVVGRPEPASGVWFAAYRRLFGVVDGQWVLFDVGAGLPQSVFHAVAVDAEGRLWVGTRDQGLYRARRPLTEADLDRFGRPPSQGDPDEREPVQLFERVWSSQTGAPTDQIESLLAVGDEMWTATPAGLFALRAGRGAVEVVRSIGEAEGLPSVRTFSLDRSPTTGALWVGTNGGLSEVDPASGTVTRTLRREDGLIGNEVWYYGSVRADAQGRIYFGTAEGLTVVDPEALTRSTTPPALHLRSAEVVQKSSGYTEAVFRYAATSFADERAVRYRYRLVGYDEEWSEPTPEPRVRYTNLPAFVVPRSYTLEVLAGTPGGAWTSRPLTHTFRVQPPWWLGPWAVLGYVLLLGVGLVGVDRLQRRRLVARERERTRLREAQLEAEAARAEQAATEARARALSAEAERQAAELSKARELADAFHRLEEAHDHLVETQTQLVQQEKMASLGRLTAGVAHELKNPLNFVTNFARLSADLTEELSDLLDAPEVGRTAEVRDILQDLRRNAETIETHGHRADEIVRHMLLHSRGSAGPRRPVDLADLVEDSIGLAERGRLAADPSASVRVTVTPASEAVPVMAAPLELGRVLVNLFDNAYDAVRERAGDEGDGFVPAIRVETAVEGGRAVVRVIDNGPGIPDEVASKIFEPFFTTKPTGQGTGLGLSLSFDIVRQHQGILSAEALPEGGTVFTVVLPVCDVDTRVEAVSEAGADHARA